MRLAIGRQWSRNRTVPTANSAIGVPHSGPVLEVELFCRGVLGAACDGEKLERVDPNSVLLPEPAAAKAGNLPVRLATNCAPWHPTERYRDQGRQPVAAVIGIAWATPANHVATHSEVVMPSMAVCRSVRASRAHPKRTRASQRTRGSGCVSTTHLSTNERPS